MAALKRQPITTMKEHRGPVYQVRYNSTGEYCLSAGDDKSIILWNPLSGIKLKAYTAHGQAVRDVVASHDNCFLGSASADRTSFYWDVATGQVLRRYRGHDSSVNCVQFNATSTVLISGGNDSRVRIMDLKSRSYEPVQVLDDAKDTITSVDVSLDEIVVGSVDGRVRLYDLRMGKLHEDFLGSPVTSVRFSSDKQSVVASTTDSTVRLVDKTTGQLLNDYTGHTHTKLQLQSVTWHDDSAVISSCEESRVLVWDLISAAVRDTLPCRSFVQAVSVHPSRYHLLTGMLDGGMQVWAAADDKEPEKKPVEKSMSYWALPPR